MARRRGGRGASVLARGWSAWSSSGSSTARCIARSRATACRCTWWCRSPTSAGRARERRRASRRKVSIHRLRMHVFREPIGRQIVAGAAFLGLAVEQRAGGGELVAEPDIVEKAGDLGIGLAAFGAADDQFGQGRQLGKIDRIGGRPAAAAAGL